LKVDSGAIMRRIIVAFVALSGVAIAQSSATPSTPNESPESSVVLPIVLSKSVDSNKAKVGDEVVARTAGEIRKGDTVLIPRDSKIFGKITQATARKRGDGTSALAIAFDRAEIKGGTAMNLTSSIQAVIAPPQRPMAEPPGVTADSSGSRTGSGGYGASPGTSPIGSSVGAANSDSESAVAGSDAQITSQTTGVVGLKDVELNTNADSALLTSNGNSLKLDSGTRLLLTITSVSSGKPAQNQK
jgi:hypothetical protein